MAGFLLSGAYKARAPSLLKVAVTKNYTASIMLTPTV